MCVHVVFVNNGSIYVLVMKDPQLVPSCSIYTDTFALGVGILIHINTSVCMSDKATGIMTPEVHQTHNLDNKVYSLPDAAHAASF